MKLLLLPVLMAFFAVAQVFCEENDPKEEVDYWTSTNQIQDGWLSDNPFREILLRMTRKPRPHQFIGLMGKRSMANAQITHKSMTISQSSLGRGRVPGSMPQGHLRVQLDCLRL
uniref:protachykinin-1 isoform X2 n=1 Tax=Scatophagus argus TaxID=75038 RepID=UPI001ED8170A|nr:protachykinin-1 isoform X2 [Scatophagus argus]